MLRIHDLNLSRNEKCLFKSLNIELYPGQLLLLTGKNGVGKSTLLQAIAGIVQPNFGKIIVSQKNIIYIGHSLNLHPDLSVYENLLFWYKLNINNNYTTNDRIKNHILNKIKIFDLQGLINTECRLLSKGLLQKVSLCKLLLVNKKIWLLDEPFSNLDNCGINVLEKIIIEQLKNKQKNEDKTGIVVMATHKEINIQTPNIIRIDLDTVKIQELKYANFK